MFALRVPAAITAFALLFQITAVQESQSQMLSYKDSTEAAEVESPHADELREISETFVAATKSIFEETYSRTTSLDRGQTIEFSKESIVRLDRLLKSASNIERRGEKPESSTLDNDAHHHFGPYLHTKENILIEPTVTDGPTFMLNFRDCEESNHNLYMLVSYTFTRNERIPEGHWNKNKLRIKEVEEPPQCKLSLTTPE